ncbi:MAG: LysR family transcriptional regulator [Lachnospiraceae bacterium]|nr:LysR family transcriptional regulator [Lachnospiraceae bacterium]
MNLEYFREFVVLADTANYYEAADRLYMGESTLSKHIKSMEKELGVSLFDRSTRKIALTNFGKLLLPYAKTIMQAQFDYTAELENEVESLRGRVTVGTISSTAKYGITGIVSRFKKLHPDSTVRMFEGDPDDLVTQLNSRKCDVIFAHLPESASASIAFESIHYCDDSLVCILPLDHPLAGEKVLHLNQLKDENFVVLAENSTIHNLIIDSCHRVGFSPKMAFICHRVDSVLDLVTKGMGVALLTEYLTFRPEDGNFPENAPFAVAHVLPEVNVSVNLCYRKGDRLSPMARQFVELVKDMIKE